MPGKKKGFRCSIDGRWWCGSGWEGGRWSVGRLVGRWVDSDSGHFRPGRLPECGPGREHRPRQLRVDHTERNAGRGPALTTDDCREHRRPLCPYHLRVPLVYPNTRYPLALIYLHVMCVCRVRQIRRCLPLPARSFLGSLIH